MPSLRLGNQETSYVVQIYNDPEWNETVKELFSNRKHLLHALPLRNRVNF